MASTYSDLKIELIGTGDQSGTWGTTTNTNLGTALGEAIAGSADVTFASADVTVTLTNTNAAQTARNLRLNLTGTTGGARNLILGSGCQIEKPYLINNGTADTITVKNTTGTGIAVPAGKAMWVYNNGTNVVDAVTYLSSLTLGTDLAVADGGTGISSGTSGGVPYFSSTTTIASSAALAANALVIGGGAGVAPLTTTTGTGVVTAIGNNTNAASGLAVLNASGNLNVAQGGTGAGTFTANNVLLGNGTSAFQVVAPGASGNVLQSNGTTWTSSVFTAPSTALTNNTRQAVTSSATTTINLNSGNVIDLTMAANITTLSFTNVPASGTPILIQIVVKNASDGTAYTIVWPNSVYWSGQYSLVTNGQTQIAPTLAVGANGVTVIALLTTDGGTKYRGWVEATITGGSSNLLYSWGNGVAGALGQNDTTTRSSPVQVGALADWSSVLAGDEFCAAVKPDGTLWTWGNGGSGRLGQNSTANVSSPVQVGALTTWASVSAGAEWCAAIRTDGSLWVWGGNANGQLGQNNRVEYSSPVQVGALTTWASVSAGEVHCAAIKTDATLWTWGEAGSGRLGLGNPLDRSSPVQVGALTNWSSVSAGVQNCASIKTDGTLWTWGNGNFGVLGQNDAISRSSPVQVGSDFDWSSVSSGETSCAAIKTDGTLWTWGEGADGQLGQGSTANVSYPAQLGALTTWVSAAASQPTTGFSNFGAAIRTDGSLWVWGGNANGQLGLGNATYFSSPVQIGLLNWGGIACGRSDFMVGVLGTAKNPA